MRRQTNMRRGGQLRSSIAGKARQIEDGTASWKYSDSFNQATLCLPYTIEEAKGARQQHRAGRRDKDRNRKLVLECLV